MFTWILRRVEPKYLVIAILCLAFGALATYNGTRAMPATGDLQSIAGVVDEVFSRCSRGNSCTHFIALNTGDVTYKVSLFYCRGAETELFPGDHLRVGFHQAGWSIHGGNAYFIDRRGYLVCSYDDASTAHEQFVTGNFRIGVLALAIGAIALIWAFIVGAAKGYK